MKINPLNAIDFYKADHRSQYPQGCEYVYSNFTPRSDKLSNMGEDFDGKIVFMGLQLFIKDFLVDSWNKDFFSRPKKEVIRKYKRRMDTSLGNGAISTEHISDLHDLGYLPIKIKALPEGARVNVRVPVYTIVNTDKNFFWITNYLESVMSSETWKMCTTATLAYEYKKLLVEYAKETGASLEFVNLQGHDFSFRGASCREDSAKSGIGHLSSFWGTDGVLSIDAAEDYYNANSENEIVGVSVPATEHSVMCMGGKDSEVDTYRRLITEVYPKGIVSIVSDTWDFWKVMTDLTVELKDEILNREEDALGLAKTVFRPDSGCPVKIICGDKDAPIGSPEYKGAIECLYEVFGGSENERGYKELNPRVGLIYGDSITLERAKLILKGLKKKGFASSNVVFGIGSYTYQYNTRDTFGFAVKATWGQVNGVAREIHKDPKTDGGIKKSAKGLLRVEIENGEYILYDQQSNEEEKMGELVDVFENGTLLIDHSLSEIRRRLNNGRM